MTNEPLETNKQRRRETTLNHGYLEERLILSSLILKSLT